MWIGWMGWRMDGSNEIIQMGDAESVKRSAHRHFDHVRLRTAN